MIKTSATIPLQHDTPFSPFSACKFGEGIRWVKDSGFDGVELVVAEPEKVDAGGLNALLEGLGLEVSTLATGQSFGLEGISLVDGNRENRERAVQKLFGHIDLSVRLAGRPNVTVGLLRGVGDVRKKAELMPILRETMLRCARYAAKKQVRINFEPINRYEAALVNSTREGAEFLHSIGDPESVGILYDTFHSNIEDADMAEAVGRYAGKISHVHLADSNRALPGDGHIDFAAIFRRLRESGYAGYVSLETLNLPDRESVRRRAEECLRKIRGWRSARS